jgi:uncharacterized protein
MKNIKIIQATQNWLSQFVIAHNICPFAKREFDQNKIYYSVAETANQTECLTTLIVECARLDTHPEISTLLLLLPRGFEDFQDYLDLLAYAEALLVDHGYEGVYQLASFHPAYYFEGVDPLDASNYTNRSPYPMLHILRESQLEATLINVADPEQIPERNIRYTRKLGAIQLQKLLDECFKSAKYPDNE